MSKYVYPAVFTLEEGGYSVDFPDLDGCYTCGENLEEAIYMAEDALSLMLLHLEREKKDIPEASKAYNISVPDNSFVNSIRCDTIAYRKRNNNRAVKKTLSVPEWLNEAAVDAGISFSQVLQDALKEKLGMT